MRSIIYILLLFNFSAIAQEYPEPGSVAADAKTIAADELFPFLHGVAITRKGQSCALIDAKGKVLVPYGKYGNMTGPFNGGLIRASIEGSIWGVLLNCRGEVIKNLTAKDSYYPLSDFNPEVPFAIASHYSNKLVPGTTNHILLGYVAIDSSGSEIQLGGLYDPSYGEGLISFSTGIGIASNPKIGFKDRKNKVVIQPQFDRVSRFSEGLAAVGKFDATGTLQWGYIDKSGKIQIPLQFSIQPGDFGNGLAAVYPKAGADFSMAFINHSGVIEMKFGKEISTLFAKSPSFESGFFPLPFGREYFAIDSLGTPLKKESLLTLWGVEDVEKYILCANYLSTDCTPKMKGQPTPLSMGQLIYKTQFAINPRGQTVGVMDLNIKLRYPDVFADLSPFDRTSNLAWAKMYLETDPQTQVPRYREGYVNDKLQFVLLKEKPSVF